MQVDPAGRLWRLLRGDLGTSDQRYQPLPSWEWDCASRRTVEPCSNAIPFTSSRRCPTNAPSTPTAPRARITLLSRRLPPWKVRAVNGGVFSRGRRRWRIGVSTGN